jgi:hypothetical protein
MIDMLERGGLRNGMPKYYFHVTDGRSTYRDSEGSSHPSLAKAHLEASRIAAELACDGVEYTGYEICLVDEEGNELMRVPVSV